MFNKKKSEEPTAASRPPAAPKKPEPMPAPEVRKRNVSVIGPTLRFKGELSANEDLVIEGQIEGTIAHQEKNLTIGSQGWVHADVHARIVEIHGEVDGDVIGDEVVRLFKTAVVRGNIQSPRLVMEDGAKFSGSVDMGAAPQPSKGVRRQDVLKQVNLSVAESMSASKSKDGAA